MSNQKKGKRPETVVSEKIKDLFTLKKTYGRLNSNESKAELDKSIDGLKNNLIEKIRNL